VVVDQEALDDPAPSRGVGSEDGLALDEVGHGLESRHADGEVAAIGRQGRRVGQRPREVAEVDGLGRPGGLLAMHNARSLPSMGL